MSTIGQSAKGKATELVHGSIDKIVRGIALEGLGRIIDKTPVDEGTARANWNTTVGAPNTAADETKTIEDTGAALETGASTIAGASPAQGDRIFVANGLPYIEALEHGHSRQAPNGMVDLTIAELQPLVDQLAEKERVK